MHSRSCLHDRESILGEFVFNLGHGESCRAQQNKHSTNSSDHSPPSRAGDTSAQHLPTPIRLAILLALSTEGFPTRPRASRHLPAKHGGATQSATPQPHEVRPLIHANARNGVLATAQPALQGETRSWRLIIISIFVRRAGSQAGMRGGEVCDIDPSSCAHRPHLQFLGWPEAQR